MKSQEIVHYLQNNPQFFEDHADALAEIYIPHPQGGRTIPLAERQIFSLREKIRLLENKLGELVQFGEENDAISEKVHQLSLQLIASNNLPRALEVLYDNLLESLSIPTVALRLWIDLPNQGGPEFSPVTQEIRDFAANLVTAYCGTNTSFEVIDWLAEQTDQPINSVALIPLTIQEETIGLLVLGSDDEKRFNPEMGVLYLKRIGELMSTTLSRFIPATPPEDN